MWLLNRFQWCISSNEPDAAALPVGGCASLSQAALLTFIRLNEHTNMRVPIKEPEELGHRGGVTTQGRCLSFSTGNLNGRLTLTPEVHCLLLNNRISHDFCYVTSQLSPPG